MALQGAHIRISMLTFHGIGGKKIPLSSESSINQKTKNAIEFS